MGADFGIGIMSSGDVVDMTANYEPRDVTHWGPGV